MGYDGRMTKGLVRYQRSGQFHFVILPSLWLWSSFNHWATREVGTIEIESQWTAARRERGIMETHVSKARHGAPAYRHVSWGAL